MKLIFAITSLALFAGLTEALFGFGHKTTTTVVDVGHLSYDQLAAQLCEPKQSPHVVLQVSRIQTIEKLHERSLVPQVYPYGPDVVQCINSYREPLAELAKIIDARQPDACSQKHVTLVEEFHRKYIELSLIRSKKYQDTSVTLPEPLRWFFIHYAFELSEVCQQNFEENLELMSESSSANSKTIFDAISGKFVNAMRTVLGTISGQDFVLVWNTIERLGRRSGFPPSELSANKITGDSIRLRMKVRDAKDLRSVQHDCRNNLRPIYGETALSAMRLVDMGYNLKGKNLDVPIGEQMRNWYDIAQTCDFLLGLETYEDPTMGVDDMVLISREEVIHFKLSSDLTPFEPIKFEKKPASSFGEIDSLTRVTADENPHKLFKLIKSNVKSSDKQFKRMLRKGMRKEMKNKLKKVKVSNKSPDGKQFVQTSDDWADQVMEETREMPDDFVLHDPKDAEDYDEEYADHEEGSGRGHEVERKRTFLERIADSAEKHPFLWGFVVPALTLLFCMCLVAMIFGG